MKPLRRSGCSSTSTVPPDPIEYSPEASSGSMVRPVDRVSYVQISVILVIAAPMQYRVRQSWSAPILAAIPQARRARSNSAMAGPVSFSEYIPWLKSQHPISLRGRLPAAHTLLSDSLKLVSRHSRSRATTKPATLVRTRTAPIWHRRGNPYRRDICRSDGGIAGRRTPPSAACPTPPDGRRRDCPRRSRMPALRRGPG